MGDRTGRVASTGRAPRRQGRNAARLLGLQREAVRLLQQANAGNDGRKSLLDASRRLEALGAEPDPGAASTSVIASPMRADLRRAAVELAAVAKEQPELTARRLDPFLQLLERVRQQLEGEVALGLAFQGSYSQTKPKDPAYGGHASAMGPAPAYPPSPDDGAPSPVTFEERTRLATKTYCGGARRTTFSNRRAAASRCSTTTATGASTSIW